MKRPHLSISELAAVTLSVGALAVSIWAAIQSQQASVQARRSEVSAEALVSIERFRHSIDRASCVLAVGGIVRSDQEQFKAAIDTLQVMLSRLQSSKIETLDKFEAQLDAASASSARVDDAITKFKLHLTTEELSKANEVCGVKG